MSNNILVVGATGNLGPPLVELLVDKGERVKAATRKPDKYPERPGVAYVKFDYDTPSTYGPALEDANRIVLIMGGLDVTPERMALPLIDQAQQMGIEHIVFMSGMNAEQTGAHWFPRIETYLMASGIDFTILRPGWFMSLFIQGRSGPHEISLPLGDAKVSFIHPHDISAVAAAAITEEEHRGKIYTLSGSQPLTSKEGVDIISRATGIDLHYIPISDETMREKYQKYLEKGRMTAQQIEYMMIAYQAGRDGLYSIVSPDVEDVLGRPPHTLEQFAAKNAHLWQTDKGSRAT